MIIEKITRYFYNTKSKEIEPNTVYKVSYKSLMVMEEDLNYALNKMFMFAKYKKLIK